MLGWVNASILAGMAALAVPVIIHLLRNRRYRPAEIGSIRFLQQAVRETVRRRRLREKLLLLARLLIVALLTALFARPFVPRADSEPETDSEALLLLARYRLGSSSGTPNPPAMAALLLVRYPSAGRARRAAAQLDQHATSRGPNSGPSPWAGHRVLGSVLAAVLHADPEQALELLDQLEARHGKE